MQFRCNIDAIQMQAISGTNNFDSLLPGSSTFDNAVQQRVAPYILNKTKQLNNLVRDASKQDLGLKCSAWKVFGSKDFGLVDLYQKTKLDLFGSIKIWVWKFLVKKNFGPKNFGPNEKLGYKNNFWVQKTFWAQKNSWAKKVFWQKVFGSKNIYGSEKCLNPKEYWVQKILGLKDFMIKKIGSNKCLVPKIFEKILSPKNLRPKKILVWKNFGGKKIGLQKHV